MVPISLKNFFFNHIQLNCFFISIQFYASAAEIKFLEFKPSIIAASAILVASKERFPSQFPSFERSIYSCEFVNEVSKD